jgi:putative hydrolase of the HAD superfamily
VALRGVVVTLDALGTLVELLAPAPRLVEQLRTRGVEVSEQQAAAALAAEIAYYRAHHDMASDAASLALLRERCARVLGDALRRAGADIGRLAADELRVALLASLRFRAYPEVPEALRALRAAGNRLVVVSNWDVSLHDALRTTGLTELVDAAISSAEAGAAKPDPRIFARALELVGGRTAGALHAGDSLENDVAGALAAGLRPVLVARGERPAGVAAGVAVIGSLAELVALAA